MPAKGSLSEQRAFKAKIHLLKEVISLCLTIDEFGEPAENDNEKKTIKFKQLFSMYQDICNKVTGLLIRAKKQGVVEFEGEALFQGKDDKITITLVKPIRKIRRELEEQIKITETDLRESISYQSKHGPIYS